MSAWSPLDRELTFNVRFEMLKPLLLSSSKPGQPSRVINVTSAAHRIAGMQFDDPNFAKTTYDPFLAYGQAKTANVLMANAVNRYYGSSGIVGLSVHPGAIGSTGIFKHVPMEVLENFGDKDAMAKSFKSAPQGAASTVWAAVSSHFDDVENGGRTLGDVGECRPATEKDAFDDASYAPHAYDPESEDRLWEMSLGTVGLAAS